MPSTTEKLTEILKQAQEIALQERTSIRSQMSEADKRVSAIYHDVEFNQNINVFSGGKKMRDLQDALKWRRRVKKKQSRIDALMSALERNIIE